MSVPVMETMSVAGPVLPVVVWQGPGVPAGGPVAPAGVEVQATGDMVVFAAWLRDVAASRVPTRVRVCPGDGSVPLSGQVRALLAVLQVQDGGTRHVVETLR